LARDIWHREPIIVDLTCVNTGTTDAILHQVGLKYLIVRNGRDLPLEPAIPHIYSFQDARLPCGRNWTVENIDTNRILAMAENDDVQTGRSKLYCVGYVSYFDAANRMRITGFCRVLKFPPDALADVEHCRFRRFRDPDYEYED
jgi:hypothetical protein